MRHVTAPDNTTHRNPPMLTKFLREAWQWNSWVLSTLSDVDYLNSAVDTVLRLGWIQKLAFAKTNSFDVIGIKIVLEHEVISDCRGPTLRKFLIIFGGSLRI